MSSINYSCAGEEFNLTTKFFTRCSASSELKDFECDKGINGLYEDKPGKMFKLDNESKGGFIQINFNSVVKPTMIKVMQPSNQVEMVKSLKIKYNDYIHELIQLKDTNSIQTRPLPNSQFSNSVMIQFDKVYGNGNNGLAFELQGYECLDPSAAAVAEDKKFEMEFENPITFADCDSTLISLKLDITVGKTYNIICEDGCQFEQDYTFYGYKIYGIKSALCRTALQEGIIDEDGGMFKVEVLKGQYEYHDGPFKLESCNPEKSNAQERSIELFSIANDTSLSNISFREGQDIDLKVIGTEIIIDVEEEEDESTSGAREKEGENSFRFKSLVQSKLTNTIKNRQHTRNTTQSQIHSLVGNQTLNTTNLKLKTQSQSNSECWTRGFVKSIYQDSAGKTEIEIELTSLSKTVIVKYPSANYSFQLEHCGLNTKGMGPCKHPQMKGDDIVAIKKEIEVKANTDISLRQQTKLQAPCASLRHGDCLVNPVNCIFESGEIESLPDGFCQGDYMLIPLDKFLKERCKILQCMYKCVKVSFDTEDECEVLCPYKKCTTHEGSQMCMIDKNALADGVGVGEGGGSGANKLEGETIERNG